MDRTQTVKKGWTMGMDSMIHPAYLNDQQYSYGFNVINRGGIVQTRHGLSLKTKLEGKNLQGMTMFKQYGDQIPSMLVAIDGRIYHASYPYENFVLIGALQFDENTPIINFQECTKSAKRNPDGTLSLVSPYILIVIQDGITNAGYWDGSTGRHLISGSPNFETPTGLWMSWTASRLWLSRDNRVYVSDIADPLTFSETEYLAERSAFQLPASVTGMTQTADQRGLLVFTTTTTTSFRAEIRDRTQWQLTPDFQRLVLPSIGCVAGKTPINHFGVTYWLSESGVTNLDAALYAQRTAKMFAIDNEMMRSKRNLSPDCSRSCSFAYEHFAGFSVPSGDLHNAHTWVWDNCPTGEVGNAGCWAGVWGGFRAVQWATSEVMGRSRCYMASLGSSLVDGKQIHIWEAMQRDRMDNGGQIFSQIEIGGAIAEMPLKFNYADIDVVELLGDVNLEIWMRGEFGPWVKVSDVDIQAEVGSIGAPGQTLLTESSLLEGFKPQSRTIRTNEFTPNSELGCGAEGKELSGIDKCIFLMLRWRGAMGIRGVRIATTPQSKADRGDCFKSESGDHNKVTEQGVTL